MKKYGFLSIVTVIACNSMWAQSTVNSTGGSTVVSGNTYEWSVGETVMTHTATAGNTVLTHGVLQPIIVSDDTTQHIDDTPGLTAAQIRVFPNPAEQQIYIQPALKPYAKLSYTLIDLQGRTILQDTVTLHRGNEKVDIPIHHLAAGGYVLRVFCIENNRPYHNSFNIQKL